MVSWFGGQTVPAYTAAKGGVTQLTKELSNDWIARGVNVNAIAPGYMATEMNSALLDPKNPRYHRCDVDDLSISLLQHDLCSFLTKNEYRI